MLRMLVSTATRTFATGTPLVDRSRMAMPMRRATTKASATTPAPGAKDSHTKKDLVAMVAADTGMEAKHVESVIDSALKNIMNSVAKGEKIQLLGFGTFEARARAAREGRNPATGEAIKIAASMSPAFSAGKKFKDTVKGVESKPAPAKKPAAKK